MKYEIEIEGLHSEYEAVTLRMPRNGDMVYTGPGVVSEFSSGCKIPSHPVLIVRRKVRKYDWSKTLGDVLVITKNGTLLPLMCHKMQPRQYGLAQCWQSNIHGVCPVDPEASIVRARFANGNFGEGPAQGFDWSILPDPLTVTAWQFVRLADGYEW